MRISIVNNIYWPQAVGGAELSVQMHAEELARRGHVVQVVCLGDAGERTLHNGVEITRIARPASLPGRWGDRFGAIREISNPSMGRRVLREVEGFAPDILHTNNLSGFSWNIWGMASAKGIPVVHTIRDFSLICRGAMFRDGRMCGERCGLCRLYTFQRIRSSREVDVVVGLGGDSLERHLSAGAFEGVPTRSIIPNVGTGAALPDVSPRALGDGLLRVGFIGRPAPEKGLELLCDAMASGVGRGWELHVAARLTESEKARLQARCGTVAVRFHGYVPASEFMRVVDVVVVPSLWCEPLGRSAIEAQCHGLPVIASRRGGLQDVVIDGVDGLLFEPDQGATGLLAALERISDPETYMRMSIAALEDRERFSAGKVLDAYESIYQEMVRKVRSRR